MGWDNWKSTGGDIQLRTRNIDNSSNCYSVEAWEADPNNPDDFIGRQTKCGNSDAAFDARGFTDGDNGTAEIYFKVGPSDYSDYNVTWYFYD